MPDGKKTVNKEKENVTGHITKRKAFYSNEVYYQLLPTHSLVIGSVHNSFTLLSLSINLAQKLY